MNALNKNRPEWAKTEEEIIKNEDNECDALLNFVNELDFDKYI